MGALAACAALATVTACSGSGGQSYESMDDVPDNTVLISGMQFNPSTVTVHVGDTVTWQFRDGGVAHDVTSVDDNGRIPADPLLDSDRKARGEYTFTFEDPGTYDYFCSIHPQMTGTVIVEP